MKATRRAGKIKSKQIRIIKMAIRQMGLDDLTYRAMLEARFGVDSCTRLDTDQADVFIDQLSTQGFDFQPRVSQVKSFVRGGNLRRGAGQPRKSGKVVSLASYDEIEKVNALASLILWRFDDGLQRFLKSRMGIKSGKIRTAEEAYKAIEGLKKIFIRQMEKEHGRHWWHKNFEPAVETFIQEHAPAYCRAFPGGPVLKESL